MVDAYEIGIQLALQDGVSAGIEAIERELAEVDRAIAATSAGLQALMLTAEAASRAAAAASGARPAGIVRQSLEAGQIAPEPASRGEPKAEGSQWNTEKAGVDAAPVKVTVASQPASPLNAHPTTGAVSSAAQEPAAPLSGSDTTLPQWSDAAAPAVISQQIAITQASSERGVGSPDRSGLNEASSAPIEPRHRGGVVGGLSLPEVRPEVISPVKAKGGVRVVTASVGTRGAATAIEPRSPVTAPASHQPNHVDQARTPARGSSAPLTGQPRAEGNSSSTAGPTSASAPQPQARGGEEGLTGSVMLDGRLVGHWLSEQMAKEASRPPGGTTFFDPRQSPAWNVSGAL